RPVAASTSGFFRRSFVSTPRWDLYIPLDRSVIQILLRSGPPSEFARYLSLPATVIDWAADPRPCLPTFPQPLLFLKPLGTTFTILPKRPLVNSKLVRYRTVSSGI